MIILRPYIPKKEHLTVPPWVTFRVKEATFLSSQDLRVKSELSLLGVLLDGSIGLLSGHLHLRTSLLRDLNNEIEKPVSSVEWNVVPW